MEGGPIIRSRRSVSRGSRGEGGGGGWEEDGGESSKKDRYGKDNQKKKGKIGRPPNKPPPLPRETPIQIVPRPSLESQDDQGPGRTRLAGRATNQAANQAAHEAALEAAHQAANQAYTPVRTPDRPRRHSSNRSRSPRARHVRRNRVPRSLLDNMAFDECLTKVNILSRRGDHWATLPVLISPHWRQSNLPMETADALEHSPSRLEGGDIRTCMTPRGLITYDKAVGLWIEVQELGLPRHLIKVPIINKNNLGVAIILGRDYIDACYGEDNWPPTEYTQYVDPTTEYNEYVYPDTTPPMPTYGIGPAASVYGNNHVDSGEGLGPAIDTNNVNYTMANAAMDYHLMEVGAGIGSGSYDEPQSGDFSLDG